MIELPDVIVDLNFKVANFYEKFLPFYKDIDTFRVGLGTALDLVNSSLNIEELTISYMLEQYNEGNPKIKDAFDLFQEHDIFEITVAERIKNIISDKNKYKTTLSKIAEWVESNKVELKSIVLYEEMDKKMQELEKII